MRYRKGIRWAAGALLAGVAVLVGTPSEAQTPAPPAAQTSADPGTTQWSDITTVIVRANAPGPAMWKLTKGESTVWVLGTLHIAPREITWDSRRFERLLKGANVLILPQIIRSLSPPRQVMMLNGTMTIDEVVSPPTYQRLSDDLTKAGLSRATNYVLYRPSWAGVSLFNRVFKANDTVSNMVPSEILGWAKADEVPLRHVKRYTAQLERRFAEFDDTQDEACLNAHLDTIERDLPALPALTDAWARGDLAAIMTMHREPPWVVCFTGDADLMRAYNAYAVTDMVTAIEETLNTPGRAVAVVPLSDLLRKDGIMDRLRADGVEITSPSGDESPPPAR